MRGQRFSARARRGAALAVTSLLLGSTFLMQSAQASVLIGSSSVQPSIDYNPAGVAQAYRSVAAGSGSVAKLTIFVDATSQASTLVAGLYTDVFGHPGRLLRQGKLSQPRGGAWNDVIMSSPVTVTAGSTYWIALLGPKGAGTLRYRDNCCGGGQPAETSAQATLSSLPGSWRPGKLYFDGPLAAYGQPGGLVPTTTTGVPPTTTPTSTPPTSTPPTTIPPTNCDRVFTGGQSLTGFTVPADEVWCLDPGVSTTIDSSANVVVNGTLVMRPASPAVIHRLRFVGIDESKFVGGGENVVGSDVGLWVMGAGRLDVGGAKKTPWTNAQAISAGASSITLTEPPVGWKVGDEITITPTAAPTVTEHHDTYDSATITAINTTVVSLSTPVRNAHPAVAVTPAKTQFPEVLNLTRNVQIEGTATGRSHIFIRSTRPQSIGYAQIRHMGPRKPNPEYAYLNQGYSLKVLGRYGLHVHHAEDGSRGSLIEGVVMRDNGNHSFVPHLSNGITFRQNIAHDVMETAYWWDGADENRSEGDPSNDILFDRNVASKVTADPLSGRDFIELSGFWIGRGGPPTFGGDVQDVAIGNVAVGVAGGDRASGFIWPADSEGIWRFEDNVAHNNREDGAFFWQTTSSVHPIDRFVSYHNGRYGVFSGGYSANTHWNDAVLYGNGITQLFGHGTVLVITADPSLRQHWRNSVFDGAGISPYAAILAGGVVPPDGIRSNVPSEITNGTFRGYTTAAIRVEQVTNFTPYGAYWKLIDNDYGAGNTFSFASDINRDTKVEVQTGTELDTLRRFDQVGVLVSAWNARRG